MLESYFCLTVSHKLYGSRFVCIYFDTCMTQGCDSLYALLLHKSVRSSLKYGESLLS